MNPILFRGVPSTTLFLSALLLFGLSIGCSETTTGASEQRIVEAATEASTIEVSPTRVQLEPGGTQQFTAVVRDRSGARIDSPVQWQARGGTITSGGLFTAGTEPGDFVVRASSGDVSATARVRIIQGALEASTIEVSPTRVQLEPEGTQQFTAVVRDRSGEPIDSPVKWQAHGGTITSRGLFTAGTEPGDYAVRASSGEASATARVRITEEPSSPPTSGVVMLGAWGCSQVTHEWRAFLRQPPPFEVWSGFGWGGLDLAHWHRGLQTGDGWRDFAKIVTETPETSDLYAEICIRGSRETPEADFRRMAEDVFREIRSQVGTDVRVWATGMADWEEEGCSTAGPEGAEIAGRMADHVISLGLALRGPTLTPWRPDELEDDRCHPNDRGEDRAAREIVDFFTD